MATYDLKRFARLHILKSVKPAHLAEFLEPYREYFASRQFDLSKIGNDMSVEDFNAMLGVLINPDADTPQRLIDALYHVDEMATSEGMETLIAEYGKAGYFFDDPDPTPADVAVRAWTMNSRLFESTYAKLSRLKPRVYRFYQGASDGHSEPLGEQALLALEKDLNDWSEKNKLGRHCRVFPFIGDGDHCYIVRRGKPHARVSTINKGESSCAFFQPETFDAVAYDLETGQLRVAAGTKGTVKLYRTTFGKHMFGSEDHFPEASLYDLQSLLSEGRECLLCDDIPGMVGVKLCKIQVSLGGGHDGSTTWEASDVYEIPEFLEKTAPDATVLSASFAVKFSGSTRARTSEVKPPNSLKYRRDGDGRVMERWLRARRLAIRDERLREAG